MVLFLEDRGGMERSWIGVRRRVAQRGGNCFINALLEVKGEIGGDDADFKQMLDGFKLALLKVLEDVQVLHGEKRSRTKSVCIPRDEKSDCCGGETKTQNEKL